MGVLYNFLVICLKLAAFPLFIALVALVVKIIEYMKLACKIIRSRNKIEEKHTLLSDDHDSDEYIGNTPNKKGDNKKEKEEAEDEIVYSKEILTEKKDV